MTKTVLLATAGLFALTGASYSGTVHPTAGVSNHFAKHPVFGVTPGSTTLYDQNGNDSGSGFTSQNFETLFDQYDSQGADDFTVPDGHNWQIKEIDVTGQYLYTGGNADTANVFFYKNKGGLPGKQIAECDNVSTNDTGTGAFVLKMPKSCKIDLKAGHYWVTVQANLDLNSTAQQWFWETNTTPLGAAAAWQDPNGGWAGLGVPSDCNTWKMLSYCLAGSSGDWMFALKGKDKG
ncbi:MAG TPA: hypothetical protein VHW69_17310 [Rhizomicrobium sp.]|jgi:hypothetical protein|nr:hypothetical protein [Rhizomicrobium sp.]